MASLAKDVTELTICRIKLDRVIVSICTLCLRPIAYSPSLDMLAIAEKAHKCFAPPELRRIWTRTGWRA